MKQIKRHSVILSLLLLCLVSSCSKEKDAPIPSPTEKLSEVVAGEWLLSTANASEWALYDFGPHSIKEEWFYNNETFSSTGAYFVDDENGTIAATILRSNGSEKRLDWAVTNINVYELSLDIYGGAGGNQLLGEAALYKLVKKETVEIGRTVTPNYREILVTSKISDFYSTNENVATVDAVTGTIDAIGFGTAFVVTSTPLGSAAIRIDVVDGVQALSDYIIGTWVTDIVGTTWERDVFGENGYFFAEWSREIVSPTKDESATGSYSLNEEKQTIAVKAVTPYNQNLNAEYRIGKYDKFSFTAKIYDGNKYNGEYLYQRLLASESVDPGMTVTPMYRNLVSNLEIKSYKSHNTTIAEVNPITGVVTGVSKGITYIDVETQLGTAVVEINVTGGDIPYDFEKCLGKNAAKVHEMLGANPYYEDATTIIYKDITPQIETVGISLDSETALVKGLSIIYNSDVNVNHVTSILNTKFIPFMSQTTDTFKAYMDTENRADATIGVTWDIPARTLTFVYLLKDLFTDYSVLLGKNEQQLLAKMGQAPDYVNDQSKSWFFYDKKGIMIVSAYFTDFTNNYDYVRSVVTKLDDTFTDDQVINYLKKKFPYYPEYSTAKELVFVPEGHNMEIYYQVEDRMIIYFATPKATKVDSRSMVNKLRTGQNSIER